jgi:hypothetical protein
MNQTSFDEIDVLLQQLASAAQQYPHMAQPNLYYRFINLLLLNQDKTKKL